MKIMKTFNKKSWTLAEQVRLGRVHVSDEKMQAVCELTKLEDLGQNQYQFHYEVTDKDEGWKDFGSFRASLDAVTTFLMMEATAGNTTVATLENTLTPYHAYNCRTGHENNIFTVYYRAYNRVQGGSSTPVESELVGAEVLECIPVRHEFRHQALTAEVTKAMEDFFRGWTD